MRLTQKHFEAAIGWLYLLAMVGVIVMLAIDAVFGLPNDSAYFWYTVFGFPLVFFLFGALAVYLLVVLPLRWWAGPGKRRWQQFRPH